jgi:hypothetical protein
VIDIRSPVWKCPSAHSSHLPIRVLLMSSYSGINSHSVFPPFLNKLILLSSHIIQISPHCPLRESIISSTPLPSRIKGSCDRVLKFDLSACTRYSRVWKDGLASYLLYQLYRLLSTLLHSIHSSSSSNIPDRSSIRTTRQVSVCAGD